MTQLRHDEREQLSGEGAASTGVSMSAPDPIVIQELEAYFAARRRGECPDRRELLGKYPEVAQQLAECLDGLELLHQLGRPLEEVAPDDPRLVYATMITGFIIGLRASLCLLTLQPGGADR